MNALNWRSAKHWNHGRIKPCRICGGQTLLLDENGRPCHKVCAERECTK